MGSYVPNTNEEQQETLREIGFDSFEALFSHIPRGAHIKGGLKLPKGLGEMEVIGKMKEIAKQNVVFKHIFRGVGAYSHYIPSIVKGVVSEEGSLTSYTPYQAEISQGILQSIFECQTVLCQLTGMDVSNTSIHNGATAAAEVAAMCRGRKRGRMYPSETTHPLVTGMVKTYCFGSGAQMVMVPEKDGVADADALRELMDGTAACSYVQQPSYYDNLEDCSLLGEITHERGARYIMGCNPISLALLPAPTECGADVAMGDGQPLDMPLSFGEPYLDFMIATSAMGRELPGRIVGETKDVDGRRTYVLTLQAREQHIGCEETSSDVCPDQALCALTASVYMAAMETDGLRETAVLCTSKTHYLKGQLEQAGLTTRYDREFFHKFVIESDTDSGLILKALEEKGILGELLLSHREILRCATKQNRREDMDQAVQIVREVCRA